METDIVTLQDIFVFEKRGLSYDGSVLGRFAATGILPKFTERLEAAGVHVPAHLFDEIVEIGHP
jgi:pilus assembly protein CpaF